VTGLFLLVHMHQFTQLDFRYDVIISRWRPWCHFMQKSTAAWWVRTASAPRGRAYAAASASSWSI